MERIDVAVIGAGVVGLAASAAIAARGLSVCVLERHARAGLDTSTHNSGVIHAGLYYPAGSLKARLSVEGRRLLYDFCEHHGVPYTRCGKVVVATRDAEISQLEALLARGRENGVEGLTLVDRDFVRRREPHVRAIAALYSPHSGTVDAEALVRALLRVAKDRGVIVLPGSPLVGAGTTKDAIALQTTHETIAARQVVNAAGLYADTVAHSLSAEPFTIYPCRGEYAALVPSRRHLAHGLVYPLPQTHSLGIHALKLFNGDVWFGPTARYQTDKDDYERDRLPVEAFLEPVGRIFEGVRLDDLRLAGSGIRPKLHPPDVSFADFMVRRDRQNTRVVHAAGIESPGLTSCLAIGRLVSDIIAEES
ncbi:MAG: NAD(P)/FAD-dependent oxidoreductase [Acidobacteriaceae bacterium]|nr:NAD(P)/FAD-dependent oxidoreductase [Acidobacteriaceae bacterium]